MNSKSVKEGGKHNMYSKSKRFIASFLAVLMAVCMLPADMFGVAGVAYAAALNAPTAKVMNGTDDVTADIETGVAASSTVVLDYAAADAENKTGASIRYAIGTEAVTAPTSSSEGKEYTAEIPLTDYAGQTVTIKAVTISADNEPSATSADLTIKVNTVDNDPVADPVITVKKADNSSATDEEITAGVDKDCTVVISAGNDESIRYNIGTESVTDPTATTGTEYTDEIALTQYEGKTVTIKAIAYKTDDTSKASGVKTAVITVKTAVTVAKPTAKVMNGTTEVTDTSAGVDAACTVVLTAADTDGIRYNIGKKADNVTAPAAADAGTAYTDAILLAAYAGETVVIKAVAVKTEGSDSTLSEPLVLELNVNAAGGGEKNPFTVVLNFNDFKGTETSYNDGYFKIETLAGFESKSLSPTTDNPAGWSSGSSSRSGYKTGSAAIGNNNPDKRILFTPTSDVKITIGAYGAGSSARQIGYQLSSASDATLIASSALSAGQSGFADHKFTITNVDGQTEYAISVTNGATIMYVAVEEADYDVKAPVPNCPEGPVDLNQKITFSAPKGVDIYVAEGDTAPAINDTNKYVAGREYTIDQAKNFTVIAKVGSKESAPVTYHYTVDLPKTATPTLSFDDTANTVTLSITGDDSDADIYYTLDGKNPVNSITKYDGTPITLSATKTIRVVAKKAGQRDSDLILKTCIVKTTDETKYTLDPNTETLFDSTKDAEALNGDIWTLGNGRFKPMYQTKKAAIAPMSDLTPEKLNTENGYKVADLQANWPSVLGTLDDNTQVYMITGGAASKQGTNMANAIRIDVGGTNGTKVEVYYSGKTPLKATDNSPSKIAVYKATTENDTERGGAVTIPSENGNNPATNNHQVGKAEFTLTETGSYYIGFDSNGGIIYRITVTENPSASTEDKVTLTFMNGTEKVTEKEVTKGEKYTFADADKLADTANKKFKGWATTNDATATVITDITPTADTDLYAVWANLYTVTLGTTGASETTFPEFPKTVEEGTKITLPTPTPADNTLTFSGWKESDATGENIPTYTGEYTVTKDVTLVPVFVDPNSVFTVTRDYGYPEEGSSTNKTDTFKVTKGTDGKATVTLAQLTTPTRSGYTFDGWVILNEGVEGDKVTADVDIEGDTTFKAKWTEIVQPTTYIVAFETANGTALAPTVSDNAGNTITDLTKVVENTIIILPNTTETKPEGKDAWKWKEYKNDALVTEYAVGAEYTVSSDVTFKGYWTDAQDPGYDDEGDEENEDNDWWTEDKDEIKEKNNGKIPAGLWIAGIYSEGYDYTGDKITPRVRVYHNVHLLAEKVDYTISYKNNVNVPTTDAANKQPTIVVKGKGNYAKQATETFKINPRSMGDESVYIDEMTVLAKKNGAALKPVPTVILSYWVNEDVEKERKLKNKKEFEIKYCTEAEYEAAESLDKITGTDSVSAEGSYRMIVTGKGNYSGISSASLEVLKSDAILASKLKVKVGKIAYSKEEASKPGFDGFKPSVEVKAGRDTLTEGTDYELDYHYSNYEAGTAYVTISPLPKTSGEGENVTTTYAFYGTRTVSFTITGKPIKSAKVTVKPEALTYSYNYYQGIIDSSDISLEYKGTPLAQGEDYGISWIQNNWAAGKATIYIYGNGEYTGELKKVVKINPRDLSDSSISVTPETISAEFSKGGTRPAITVKYTFNEEAGYSYNLVEGRDYTVTYKSNNNFKKSPSLVIKGKGNFKGSITKTFTFDTKDISDVYFDVPNVVVNRGGKYGSKPVLSDRNGTKEVKLALKKDYTLAYYDMTEKADEPATEADGDTEEKEEGTLISNINKFTDGKAGSVIKVVASAVEGSGYTGKAVRYYTIRENDFSKVKIKVANKEFTGKAVTITADDITITGATLALQEDPDSETDGYYIDPASYVNNVKKGTAKVTLIGTGKYAGSKTVSFKITAKEVKWDRPTTN